MAFSTFAPCRLFRPRPRLWRRAGTARHISGLRPPNCLGLVGLWPPSRRRGVPALRTPFGRVLAPPAASRPSIAHYASLRVLGTSALRAFTFLQAFASTVRNRRSASLASSLAALVAHWAHFGLFRSSIRNSRLATLPLASLLCSLDFRFACFAHCARRSSVPQAAASVRPAKNTRNDVHAVISD